MTRVQAESDVSGPFRSSAARRRHGKKTVNFFGK
jgi:hypothetical protein